MDGERIPFQVTPGAAVYENIARLPVTVLLDNLCSAYNVGSFFRIADAASGDCEAGFREGRRRADCRAETRGAPRGCARYSD